VAVIATNIFFKEIIEDYQDSFESKIIFKVILIIITVVVIVKYSLFDSLKSRKFFLFFLLISLLMTILSFFSIKHDIENNSLNISNYKHFLLSCFGVGLFEELFFRIFMFSFILKILEKDKKRLLKSIIFTSLFFGFAHFSNFFNPEYSKLSVINQSLFAFSIGILFQSLYVRFNSFIFIVTLHALTNYFGSYRTKLFEINNNMNTNYENDFFSTLLSIAMFSIIVILISYFLVRKKLSTNNVI
jgi:membrane protease YdiL (CAAX protease family)